MRARRIFAGGLATMAVTASFVVTSNPASADTYDYSFCDGVVFQYGPNNTGGIFWYDHSGNWGEVPQDQPTLWYCW